MIKPGITMTIRRQEFWGDASKDAERAENDKAWVVVDAETTANGKTWLVKAVKKDDDLRWRSFSVAEKQLGAPLDPSSELFSRIQARITREYAIQAASPNGADYSPFSIETRAFLSALLDDLEAIKSARAQDMLNAETPTARLMAALGAEAVEDVAQTIRKKYQSCINMPEILDAAIAARIAREHLGKTEL